MKNAYEKRMPETCSIRVNIEDLERMRNECKSLFLRDNPKFKRVRLTDKFLFHKLVEYYQRSIL